MCIGNVGGVEDIVATGAERIKDRGRGTLEMPSPNSHVN